MKKFILFILFFSTFCVKASHISGGQITYNCLGNNVYEVKLTYFWDCQGGFNPGTTQTINVNGCGTALALTVTQSTLTPGDGITADGLCANSGLAVCKKRIDYIGTITLPSACNSWTFSIGSCCRGGNITNITGGTGASYYHFATLNNTSVTCNNSPNISIGTLPNFCANQPACFNLGATEIDGHTLSYAFISAYQTATTFVTYAAGYTGAAPMTGITINPTTGQINFTPTLQGDFVITVQITEKDALGNIIGTIMRDFQVIVTNCSNQTVTCGQGAITNVTSGSVPGGSGNTLQICENIPFCFDVTFTDPNIGDSVKLSSPNMATTLPGSSMVLTYTPGIKNQIKATICWTPPQGSSGLNTSFVLIVKDNACPVPGTQVINYFIDVLPATSAGPDRIICGPQAASITATGSSTVFAWTDLAGTPVTVGPAFSCNPCNNPVIKPAVTSTYVVTNIGGGVNCKNKDTLVIFVVPDFTLTANVATSNGCLNSAVQFTSNVNPSGPGYSYTWSPSAPLTTTNSANTSAIYSNPGVYNYTLTAMNSQGCTKQSSSISFTANPVVTPQFTVVPSNTVVCANGSIPLSINFGNSLPATCGLAATGCAAPAISQIGSGTTQNSNTGWPCVLGNYYKNNRHQLLFTAAELNAAGITPGKLSSIAFQVISMMPGVVPSSNGSSNYSSVPFNYTIKLKCTTATSLTTTFDNTGLVQVYNGNYSAVVGWNTFNFNQAYEWAPGSNVLVDICYNLQTYYTSNPIMNSTATSVARCAYAYSDSSPMCGTTSIATTSTNRPNVRFGNCSSTPPASAFSYSWSPAMGLSNASVSNPTANISSSVQYTVVVTPTAAATCSNVGTTSLTVIVPVSPTINPVGSLCTNASTVQLTASQAGGTWSLTASTTTTGIFTPSLASVGNNTVTYLYGGAGCSQTVTAVIPIEQFVPATISGTINPICLPSNTINLPASLITSTLGVGVWSGNGVSGTTFDPNNAGTGTHTLTYNTNSVPTASLCPATSSIAVQLNSVAQPTITTVTPLCTNASSITLVATPAGGVWSGTGVTSTGIFSPSLALVGNNTYTYSVGSSTCSAFNTTTISIEQFVPATISGTINPICLPSNTINLSTSLTTSTLGVGVWSGNGVSGTTFDPNNAGAGTHTLTYNTNSVPTTSLCPATSSIAVQLNSVAQPTITTTNPLCTNASSLTLVATPVGGTWSGTGVTSTGIFTPSLALVGNNTYTYSVGSSTCSAFNTTTISVEQYVPSTITGAIATLCSTSPVVDLSTALGTSTLGTGVWSGIGVTGNMFDPAVAGGAVHTLTYNTNSSSTPSLCPSASTINITVNSQLQPTIATAGPYCDSYAAQNMTVTPTGGVWSAVTPGAIVSGTGNFSPASSVLGNNTLLYTLTNGPCVNTETISITVVHFVPSTITNTVGPYCIYAATTNLQNIAQFAGGTWSGPGVSGALFNPSSAGAGIHVITYSTNPSTLINCGNSNTIAITVNPKPEANAFPNVFSGCNPVAVNYMTSSYPTGLGIWDFGDGTPRDTGLFVNHIYTIPGTYTATLYYTDNIGCKDTTKATSGVTSYPLPIASFDPSVTETTVVDGQVEFNNHSTVLGNNTYSWDIGGLYYSTSVNESYLFVNSGNYVVTLIATTPEGCVDDTSLVIVVNPDVVLYVPNAFTPGSDNLNDVFQIFLPPTGVDYSTFSLLIYDRWGELVYKTNDVAESWNGSKNNSGETMKQDTYVYKIYFKDEKKKSYQKMGHVTLLRK